MIVSDIELFLIIIVLLVCQFLGIVTCVILNKRKKAGELVINTSDPDKDVYSLNISIPLEEIPRRKEVSFKVVIK